MKIDHRSADSLPVDVRALRLRADDIVRALTRAYRDSAKPVVLFGERDERLPVDLSQYAEQRRVRGVEFRRLLDRGGLALMEDGFIIYVGCTSTDRNPLSEEYRSGGHALPSQVRFTIAHELAHTCFFDLRNGRQVQKVSTDRFPIWERVEAECDRAASQLLIPIEFREGRNMPSSVDVLDPEVLISEAAVFGVPVPVLIIRLQEQIGGITDRLGAILHVQPSSVATSVPLIKGFALSGAVRELLGPNIGYGVSFDKICTDRALCVYGGDREDTVVQFVRRRIRIRCKPCESREYIVTLELT